MSETLKMIKTLTAKGRAGAMSGFAIQSYLAAVATSLQGTFDFSNAIKSDTHAETMREDAIKQWEKQFGIIHTPGSTLPDRAKTVDAEWGINGPAGPGYIQYILQRAGFDLEVVENIPAEELVASGVLNFGYDKFGFENFGASTSFPGYLLGNGRITQNDGTRIDPVNIPAKSGESNNNFGFNNFGFAQFGGKDSSNRWVFAIIIQAVGGGFLEIPSQRRGELERLLLKMKQAHIGAFLRVNYI